MVLRLANKYQIALQIHKFALFFHSFLYRARKVFCKIMQHMFLRKFDFSYSIEMYHFNVSLL